MADRRNTPWDSVAERVAELLKHQLNKPSDQAEQQEKLSEALERLIAQQQQTNDHLQKLQSSTEAQTQAFRNWQETTRRSASKQFLRKMALEIPPVVIAVLLAFGINSWWQNLKQQRLTDIARENIIEEVKSNYFTLQKNIEDNRKRIPKIKSSLETLLENPSDTIDNAGRGIDIYTLTEAAWEAANSSGILSNLNQDFVLDAYKIYNLQLQRDAQGFTSGITVEMYKPENKRFMLMRNQSFIKNLIGNDEFLLKLYDNFLEEYATSTPTE